MIRRTWRTLLDAVLGGRCPGGCGQRVFPKDRTWHHQVVHDWAVRR